MSDLVTKLDFNFRPAPVMVEHRRMYKLSQLLLILELASRSGRSSLTKLQLFNWALKSAKRTEALVNSVLNNKLDIAAWGFDPAVSISLRFAAAEGLVRNVSTGYQISEHGRLFVSEIMKDTELLVDEKKFIKLIGKKVTEDMVLSMSKRWGT